MIYSLVINHFHIFTCLLSDAFKYCGNLGRESVIIGQHAFLIVSIRAYHCYLAYLLLVQRKKSVLILQQYNRLSGHLESMFEMFSTFKHRKRSGSIWHAVVRIEHSQTHADLE